MTSSRRLVVTIGDATLSTVTPQLSASLAQEDRVVNFAIEGFTTGDVLYGGSQKNGRYYPLDELLWLSQKTVPTHIVLSVGSDEILKLLPRFLFTNANESKNQLFLHFKMLQNFYKKIIDKITQLCPSARIIVMLPYAPGLSPDMLLIYYLMQQMAENKGKKKDFLTSVDIKMYELFGCNYKAQETALKILYDLMAEAYEPIIDYVRKKNIPIIDMMTSFDPANKNLYDEQVKPSSIGSAIIAELITHVIGEHDFEKSSVLYVKPSGTGGNVLKIEGSAHWHPNRISIDDDAAVPYFIAQYQREVKRDKSSWLGIFTLFANSKLDTAASKMEIIQHAGEGGERTWSVMKKIGWL